MRLAKHCDPAFLHGFEKSGLRLGRCAVDLVCKNDVGEQRTGLEHKLALTISLLKNGVSRNVTGKKVWSELNALSVELEAF